MCGFMSVSLIHLSFFMPIPCSFYYYSSVVELEIKDGDTSGSFFIIQDCFSYPFCFFPYEDPIPILSRSVKNCVGILMGIALHL